MDKKELKALIQLMEKHGLVRLEIEEAGKRCVLEKAQAPTFTGFPQMPMAMAPAPQMISAAPAAAAAAAPAAAAPAPKAEGTITFNSPMVGTFYRTASPDAEAFVKVGDQVEPETTLCLIEAMKVFNEIKAETRGIVVEVLAENQEAVEYNQPLFLIKPL
jgi:acetyl-CoA carboxylase biotin carboxyl carrier protein